MATVEVVVIAVIAEVVVVEIVEIAEKEVDVNVTRNVADALMAARRAPSMSPTRPLSPRCRDMNENSNLASCGTPSVKMIRLHDMYTFTASSLFSTPAMNAAVVSFIVSIRVYSS